MGCCITKDEPLLCLEESLLDSPDVPIAPTSAEHPPWIDLDKLDL